MSEEKPLHVQVAEALCDWCSGYATWPGDRGTGHIQHPDGDDVPRYDLDWAATGPLIDRFEISLNRWWPGESILPWYAQAQIEEMQLPQTYVEGYTPLQAICNLIIELKRRGKL